MYQFIIKQKIFEQKILNKENLIKICINNFSSFGEIASMLGHRYHD